MARSNQKNKQRKAARQVTPYTASVPVQRAENQASTYTQHKFVSTLASAYTITGGPLSPILGNFGFSLNQLPQAAQLTALYDAYRIDTVELTFTQRKPSTSESPRLYACPDFDSIVAPTSIGKVTENVRTLMHVFTPTRPTFKLALQPRSQGAAETGAGYVNTLLPAMQFHDSSSPSVRYLGVKYAVENFTDTLDVIDVSVKFWVTMLNSI